VTKAARSAALQALADGWRQKLRPTHPLFLTLAVTARCDLRCDHCFYWREIDDARHREELTLREIERLAPTIGPLRVLLLSGGEPYLRDDLPHICEAFARHTGVRRITIPTNGLSTDHIVEATAEACRRCPSSQIVVQLSIDGPRDVHDASRGAKGAFDRMLKTYDGLQAASRRIPNLRVQLCYTLTSATADAAGAVAAMASEELGTDDLVVVSIRGEPRRPATGDLTPERYRAAIDALYGGNESPRRAWVDSLFHTRQGLVLDEIHRTRAAPAYRGPCYAGIVSAVISDVGLVFPCELNRIPMGDLRAEGMDFRAIWTGATARETRRTIRRSRCFCTHETDTMLRLSYSPWLPVLVARRLLSPG